MAATENISINVPRDLLTEVNEAVLHGEFGSSDQVFEAALHSWRLDRHLVGNDASIRAAWNEALQDDSPGIPMNEVLDRLEIKYRAIAESEEQ